MNRLNWLGKVPERWNVLKLRQILTPFSEKNHPNMPLLSVVREKGVIIRNIEDKEENHNYVPDDLSGYKLVKKGQFAMNKMKAWQGSYGISKYDGIVSPAYFVFDINHNMNKDFFNLAIRSKVYVNYFGQASDGIRVGQWDLSMKRMKEIPFFLPPRSEQDQIVKFLDWKVSCINKLIGIKKKEIQCLYSAKVSNIKEIIDDFKCNCRLKNIAKSYGRIGFRGYSAEDLVEKGQGVITASPSNISDKGMDFKKCSYLSWEKYEESPEIQLKKNDILIVKTGSSYGKTGFIDSLPMECTINPQLLIIRPNSYKVIPEYLFYSIKYGSIQGQINKGIIGSTIPTISESRIMSYSLGIPELGIQQKRLERIKRLEYQYNKLISSYKNSIIELNNLKIGLVSNVVTGKIDVRNIEIPEYEFVEDETDDIVAVSENEEETE